jgi:5-methyltetrahydropteroyltriglutamate--homocysteine methyltransferase
MASTSPALISPARIRTTHVGSLPRSERLLALMRARLEGEPVDQTLLANVLCEDVREVVKKQVAIGIDVVSDGELSKPSYATYVTERLTGFGGQYRGPAPQDLRDYKEFARAMVEMRRIAPLGTGSCCKGPVAVKDTAALEADLQNLKDAVRLEKPHGAFMNAASPGVIGVFQKNEFYATEDEYLAAVAEAMRAEYEAIVAAGFVLQIDSPDLAMSRHTTFADLDDEAFVRIVERNVAVLNTALRNVAAERLRMHVCWGNYEGPHHRDIPLARIVRAVLKAKPRVLLLEGANPRHEHEWKVFTEVGLPDDKILAPGVVDSTTNYIEHPEVVAQRLLRYVDVVGHERVMAGTDCGFSTISQYPTVHPDIVWKKLESLVAGAAIASRG